METVFTLAKIAHARGQVVVIEVSRRSALPSRYNAIKAEAQGRDYGGRAKDSLKGCTISRSAGPGVTATDRRPKVTNFSRIPDLASAPIRTTNFLVAIGL